MLLFAFFRWWYSDGWLLQVLAIKNRLMAISRLFSVDQLIRTLFAPWRRIISAPGRGMQAHFQAAVDNAVGRLVGFFVRSIVLLAAGISAVFTTICSCALVIVWPIMPFLPVLFLILGVMQI